MVVVRAGAESPAEDLLKTLVSDRKPLEDAIAKTPQAALMRVHLEAVSFDPIRHALWASVAMNAPILGDMRQLQAIYPTRSGNVLGVCAGQSWEWEKREPQRRRILESIVIQPSDAPPASVETLMKMGATTTETLYRDLSARAKSGDLDIDFRALRFACLLYKHCDEMSDREGRVAAQQALQAGRTQEALERCGQILDKGFPNAEAHLDCNTAAVKLGKTELPISICAPPRRLPNRSCKDTKAKPRRLQFP